MSSPLNLVPSPTDHMPKRTPLASWYTQGTSDGLGDRLLMFDNTSAASLELLRFRSDLAETPGFERGRKLLLGYCPIIAEQVGVNGRVSQEERQPGGVFPPFVRQRVPAEPEGAVEAFERGCINVGLVPDEAFAG